jgi:hypothetical protein
MPTAECMPTGTRTAQGSSLWHTHARKGFTQNARPQTGPATRLHTTAVPQCGALLWIIHTMMVPHTIVCAGAAAVPPKPSAQDSYAAGCLTVNTQDSYAVNHKTAQPAVPSKHNHSMCVCWAWAGSATMIRLCCTLRRSNSIWSPQAAAVKDQQLSAGAPPQNPMKQR